VAKELDGYGLTVAGEQPVFVDSIKKDGAAAKAGVRERDQILKINGMPVSSSNHFEVLRMISCEFFGNLWAFLKIINSLFH
jgi:C-terminal processing protease CtpA/Prc